MAKGQVGAAFRGLRKVLGGRTDPGLSDCDLLRRFSTSRDEEAFAELVRRHGGRVLRVCRHVLGQEQEAEDAFQATFLVLARKASSVGRHHSVASWLHGVAVRTSLNARKIAMRRAQHERQPQARAMESAASAAALRELQALLDEEVQRLPEKYRAPFVLCCLEGKGRAEVAHELGWKEGTVGSRLARARALLQVRLARRGVALPAALTAYALSGGEAAAVSGVLVGVASRAAVAFVTGHANEVVAAQAVTLARGVLNGMTTTRLKAALFITLGVALLAAGTVLAATQAACSQDEAAVQAARPPAEPKLQQDRPGQARQVGKAEPPRRMTARQVRVFKTAQVDRAYAFAFSPDGKLAACGTFRNIHTWELITGEEVCRFETRGAGKVLQQVYSLTFTQDGKGLLAACGDGSLRLFDVGTLKEVRRFSGHRGAVLSAGLARDDTRAVSAGADGTVRLWETGTGRECKRFQGNRGAVWCAALSPDGRHVLGAGGHESNSGGIHPYVVFDDTDLRLWDVTTGTLVRRFKGHPCTVTSVAFSPDGRRIVSCGKDRTVRLWDMATGKELKRFGGGLQVVVPFERVDFSPDGKLILACDQYRVRILQATTLEELGSFEPPPGRYQASGFAPDGRRMFTGMNERAILWEWRAVPAR
jgi:RNA polymerase sigma factor (sigma-70 family)